MRNGNLGVDPLGEQVPQLRVAPAEVVARAVSVCADTGA
jgi:hypothetical protein